MEWQRLGDGAERQRDGNNHVWRTFSFPAVTTSRVRVLVHNALSGYSVVTEIEAYQSVNANTPPTVSLSAPADGATYTAPATIDLTASASDSDGIDRVEFYQGSSLLGTATASPYSYTWNNVPAGTYTLTAKAYDSLGASTVTAPVNVTVSSGGTTRVNAASQTNGGVASASSTYSAAYPAQAVNNGDRKGTNWGSGGGWADATLGSWPTG